MNIRHLQYFIEVSLTGSLTRAALNLHISQPALSKAIKNLEKDLEVRLFDNQKNHLVLTDTGSALLTRAQSLVLEFENIVQSIHDVQDLKTGQITLGIPMLISFLYFCDILRDFKNHYPGVNLDIIETGDDAIVEKVGQGNVDIGVVTCPLISSDFFSIPIFTDEVVAFFPKKNALSGRKVLTFKDLKGQYLHMFSSDFALYGQVIGNCLNDGFRPNISSTSSQRTFIVDMAQTTNGIAILPRPVLRGMNHTSMCVLPFQPRFAWNISVILKKNKYVTYAMQRLLECIRDFFGKVQENAPEGD